MKDETRFKAVICALIDANEIYPTGIVSEYHVEWDATKEGKQRVIQSAIRCGMCEVDALVGNVLNFEIDHMDCAAAIASAGPNNLNPLPDLGAEVTRKVREQIYKEFETLEYMSAKELWFAFKNNSNKWPEVYAAWDRQEGPDPLDKLKERIENQWKYPRLVEGRR